MSGTGSFEDFVRQNGDMAYNFAYRLSGNESDARDLVQEAFSRALKNWDRFDSTKPFGPWLNTILHNVYLDGVRRYESKHATSLDNPTESEKGSWEEILSSKDPNPLETLSQNESDQMVQRALDALPIHYKTAVILCDIENMPYEKISEIMKCPIGTVRSRIHQGRALLKKIFFKLSNEEVAYNNG